MYFTLISSTDGCCCPGKGTLKDVIAPLSQSDTVQDKKNSKSLLAERVYCIYSVWNLWAAESGTLTDILTRNIIRQKVLVLSMHCKNQSADALVTTIQNIRISPKKQEGFCINIWID